MELSLNLNAIMAQRLVVGVDGERVVAVEVLVNTPYISKLIREGKFNEIKEVMEKGKDSGMVTFDQSLFELFKARKIDLKMALANADSSTDLEWRINFGGGVQELKNKSDKVESLEFPDSSAS